MMIAICAHLDQIRVEAPEEIAGCEECLKVGCYVDEVSFVVEPDQLGSGS